MRYGIFRPGILTVTGSVRFCEQWPAGNWLSWTASSAPSAQAFFSKDYKFTSFEEGHDFAAFWSGLQEARTKRFIETAIRRFGYAGDRDLPDDKLVDLMIAAESLFSAGRGRPTTASAGNYGKGSRKDAHSSFLKPFTMAAMLFFAKCAMHMTCAFQSCTALLLAKIH